MSGESPLALAVSDAPQLDCFVIRPTDDLPRIPWVELDAEDARAAIFSNVSELLYASPPLSGGGVEPTHAKFATFRTMRSPVALESVQALAC